MRRIDRLVVCGVGLIGGSFAMALREAGAVGEIVGVGRSQASLDAALARGVIDRACLTWADALPGADFVLLATPVGQMDRVMAAMAPHLAPGTVVTDAGSTKRDVIEAAYRHLDANLATVVPSHPIAGAETSGVGAAFATLELKLILARLAQRTELRLLLSEAPVPGRSGILAQPHGGAPVLVTARHPRETRSARPAHSSSASLAR